MGRQTLLPWLNATFGIDLMRDQAQVVNLAEGACRGTVATDRYLPN
jgi:hypothetical protein